MNNKIISERDLPNEYREVYRFRKKSGFRAFLIWMFLWWIGGLSFYLDKKAIGFLRVLLFVAMVVPAAMPDIFGTGTGELIIGVLFFGIGAWSLWDLITLGKQVRICNNEILNDIAWEMEFEKNKANKTGVAPVESAKATQPEPTKNSAPVGRADYSTGDEQLDQLILEVANQCKKIQSAEVLQITNQIYAVILEICNQTAQNEEYAILAKNMPKLLEKVIKCLKEYQRAEAALVPSNETEEIKRTQLEVLRNLSENFVRIKKDIHNDMLKEAKIDLEFSKR